MQEEKYLFNRLPEEYYYEFFSEGPKGKIRKLVRYSRIMDSPGEVYNLGFGDWDVRINDVNDRINSNNHDKQKVLATVAETVLDFIKTHHDATIFVQGSTASRTRLYQMGINTYLKEIEYSFSLFGFTNGSWLSFEKGKNYDAFLIRRKK